MTGGHANLVLHTGPFEESPYSKTRDNTIPKPETIPLPSLHYQKNEKPLEGYGPAKQGNGVEQRQNKTKNRV